MKHALLAISAAALLLSILACSGSSKADQPLQSPEQALISMSGDWSGPMKLNAIDQSVDMNVNIDGQTFTMRSATDPDGAPTTLSIIVTNEGGKPTLDLAFVNPDGVESKQLCAYSLPSDTKTLNICCGTAPGAPRPASAAPCDAKSDMSLALARGSASAPAADAPADASVGEQGPLDGDWVGFLTIAQTNDTMEGIVVKIGAGMLTMTNDRGEALSQRMTLGESTDGVTLPVDLTSDMGTQRCAATDSEEGFTLCCTTDDSTDRPDPAPCTAAGLYKLKLMRPE